MRLCFYCFTFLYYFLFLFLSVILSLYLLSCVFSTLFPFPVYSFLYLFQVFLCPISSFFLCPSFYCTKSLICSSSEATHMATDKNQIRVIIPPEGSTPSLWGSYTTKPSTYVEKKFDGAQLVNVRWAFCTSQICNSQWSSVWRDFAIIF